MLAGIFNGYTLSVDYDTNNPFKRVKTHRQRTCHYHPKIVGEDNTGVVSIITNMVSRSPELMSELRRLLVVLEMLDCELSVHYIKSAENKVADYFSLLLLISSWHSFVCLRGSADKCSPKQVGWVSPLPSSVVFPPTYPQS